MRNMIFEDFAQEKKLCKFYQKGGLQNEQSDECKWPKNGLTNT